MYRSICFRYALFLILIASASMTLAMESSTPRITAQGFDISVAQEGVLGAFGQLRVRFEAPARIEELYVKERSYDVDLARTPEMGHFPLFGLKTQVRQLTDVTLDFQAYLNEKLESAGDYTIELRVTDREGNSASTNLQVQVSSPTAPDRQSAIEPIATDSFSFVRTGSSAITGVDDFGITWRTVESNEVVIELTSQGIGANRIIEISPSDYEEIRTREELDMKISGGRETPALHFSTAEDNAAGTVFGVINKNGAYLFKITRSYTSMSRIGTTVTLVGEYKH